MALLYCLLIFLTKYNKILNIILATCILLLGVYITFIPKKKSLFLKQVFIAYLSSFTMGGIGMGIFFYTNIGNVLGNSISNISIKILIASTSMCYITSKIVINLYKKYIIKRQIFYKIKIYFKDKSVELNTLLDTGNSLTDPISKVPVIIVEFNSIKEILSDRVKIDFYKKRELEIESIFQEDNDFKSRLRIIPYSSLGNKSGILVGFRPDKIEVIEQERKKEVSNTIIGIYNDELSKNGNYQGLLNPEIIN